MKKQLLDYIYNESKTDFVPLNIQLTKMFGTNYEKAKTVLREIHNSGQAEITGELFKLGSTQGDTKKTWDGETEHYTKSFDFSNVPIKGKIKEYEPEIITT